MTSYRTERGRISFAVCVALALLLGGSSASLAQGTNGQSQQATEASEAALSERIQAAYALMTQESSFEDGYAKLRAALVDAARTDLYVFTVKSYSDAGATMYRNDIIDYAEEIFAEGVETRAMKEDLKERAEFYLNYGFVKKAQRDYRGMVSMFGTSTNLYAQYYGNESSEVMYATDHFAVSIADFGAIASAINLEQGTLKTAEKVFGPDDRFTWKVQNNLADMLRQIGAPSRALEYDLNVLAKRTGYYGPNHFNVLVSANNTAQDYLDLGRYDEAERHFQQNRNIAATLNQEDKDSLIQRAEAWILYTRLVAGAQPLDDRATATVAALIDDANYPDILRIKIAQLLAGHFSATGDDGRARRHLDQAYELAQAAFGPGNPLTFSTRVAIATAKANKEPAAAAADFALLDTDMIFWNNSQVSSAGSRVVAEAVRSLADDMLYAYARFAETYPTAVPAFADAARRWPTLEDGKRDTLRKVMRLISPDDKETRHLLQRAMQLSYAYQVVASSGGNFEAEGYPLLDQMKVMDDQVNGMVNEKYDFTESDLEKALPLAQDLLQANEALVSYFITRKWRADRESAEPLDDERLYAIVTRRGEAPRLYNLGDPRKIIPAAQAQQMASLRSTRSTERGAVPLIDFNAAFAGLNAKLIAPLEPSLAGAGTLFVVPDGKLFAVPFPLLQEATGATLEDRFVVRVLTRPEAIFGVSADQSFSKGRKAVLAGGLDYSNGAEKGAEPLPGTKKEVDAIAAILRQSGYSTGVLTGTEAREKVLHKDIEAASIAHLATHGAYRDQGESATEAVDALWLSDVVLSQSGDRQSMKSDDDDGRLYGMEVMNWDLSGLDLLVLSACETARGQETFVGGLRGLPTAINIAGAKRSLLTLWPVDDAGTAEFMVQFYRHLSAGKTYPEALRQTRRDARDGKVPNAHDPRVWAAFVMFEN